MGSDSSTHSVTYALPMMSQKSLGYSMGSPPVGKEFPDSAGAGPQTGNVILPFFLPLQKIMWFASQDPAGTCILLFIKRKLSQYFSSNFPGIPNPLFLYHTQRFPWRMEDQLPSSSDQTHFSISIVTTDFSRKPPTGWDQPTMAVSQRIWLLHSGFKSP